nr:MAG TPA: ADP-ribosyltransferase exoenzyme [Caudoviricetes sp.]
MPRGIEFQIESLRARHVLRKAAHSSGAVVMFRQDGDAVLVEDGGEGSGNWGHEGRKGKIGGSAPGGGVHNRQTTASGGYTSFSKKKVALAKPHKANASEFYGLPDKAKVVLSWNSGDYDPITFTYDASYGTFESNDGMVLEPERVADYVDDETSSRIFIPNSASPNYSKSKQAFEISPERMKNAKTYTHAVIADKALRPECGKVWKTLSPVEKMSLVQYTGNGYSSYNGALRGKEHFQTESTRQDVENMTKSIAKSHLTEDLYLYRGVSYNSVARMFGLKKGDITAQNADSLVGKSGTDDGFMSCGTIPSAGYDKGVYLKIFCPKGTEAIYAEPFSQYGGGKVEEDWDGESTQTWYDESETIIQRGTSYCCTGSRINEEGKLEVEIAITGQNAKPLSW